MHSPIKQLLATLTLLVLAGRVTACDSCSVYFARHHDRPGFTLSTAHQFTRLGSVWQGDTRLGNPADQYLDSQITQLAVGYQHGGRWSAQFTLPYIVRTYRRPDHALIDEGRVRGIGDAILAGRYRVWQRVTARGDTFEAEVRGGVEFATGSADLLGAAVGHPHHHHSAYPDSGIHGHDLALGSGSTDRLVGARAAWQRGRLHAHLEWQRKLRRPGAFDYRLADESSWELAGGGYLLLTHEHALALQLLASADRKDLDTLAGAPQVNTGSSVRYLGLRFVGTVRRHFSTEAGLELPVRIRTSETMVVPDYRLRLACNWLF